MRIAVPMRRRVLALAMLAAGLVALLPLRLAVAVVPFEEAGLGARQVGGPIWAGRVLGLAWHGLSLGDVDARVQPLPLLLGRVRLAVAGDAVRGALIATPSSVGVEDVTGTLPVGDRFPDLRIAAFDLSDVSVRTAGGRCERASGRVTARVAPASPSAPASVLSGAVRCDGGALLLPLTAPSGLARLDLRFTGRRWRARLTASDADGRTIATARDGLL